MSAPLAPTARGWGFLVSAAVVTVLWRLLEINDLRYLMVLPVVMVLLSLLVVAVVPPLARVRVRVTGLPAEPEVGDAVGCSASVSTRIPARLRLRLLWVVGDRAVSRELTVGREVASSRMRFRAARRGPQWCGVGAVEFRDPLGLMVRRQRMDAGRDLLVVPRGLDGVPEEVPGPVRSRGTGADAGRVFSSGPGTPAGAVREFRTGDALRQVHWKQSARLGKLLVNQYDAADRSEACLMLASGGVNYASAESVETAVSAAVTVADRLLAEGYRVTLSCSGWPAGRPASRGAVRSSWQVTAPTVEVCSDGGEVRRWLALIDPVAAADADAPGQGGSGEGAADLADADVLVTGRVSAELDQVLRDSGFHGELLAVDTGELRGGRR